MYYDDNYPNTLLAENLDLLVVPRLSQAEERIFHHQPYIKVWLDS